MSATTSPPIRPPVRPTTGIALWGLIPQHVRRALRAVVPLDYRDRGDDGEGLIVAVGSGVPTRWLQVNANDAGELEVRLWEVRRAIKGLAGEVTTAAALPALLLRWSKQFGLS